MAWMIRNQFCRRNLSPAQRGELALRLKPLLAEKAKENQVEHGGTAPGKPSLLQNSGKVFPAAHTDKELAKVAGVSHDTISKVKAVLEEAPEEVKEAMRAGTMTVNKIMPSCRGFCRALT